MTKTVLNTKISEVPHHDKYITTRVFNRLTAENSNQTKHLEVQKKVDSLITKNYYFFLARI